MPGRPRPNVVLIITHDTGRHLGCYGWPVATPHLDRLAAEGVRFDRHFCVAAQCSPSRSALMTGRWPHCNGVMGLAPRWTYHAGEQTLAQCLRDSGYETVLVGVQHEGANTERLGYRQADTATRDAPSVALKCATFLRDGPSRSDGPPFLLVAGFNETHRPFDRPEYQPDEVDGVRIPPYLPEDARIRRELAMFQGSVRTADQAVGTILQALDTSGLAQETIVVFTVDHGIAFPRAKGMSYDPGLETALLVRWPGRIRAGRVSSDLLCNADLMPTLLQATQSPPAARMQGRSFLPLLLEEAPGPRQDFFFEMTWHDRYNPHRGIRTQRHKYVRNFHSSPLVFLPLDIYHSPSGEAVCERYYAASRPAEELYDLQHDPLEQQSLVGLARHAETLAALRARVQAWMEETEDPLLQGPVAQPPPPQRPARPASG